MLGFVFFCYNSQICTWECTVLSKMESIISFAQLTGQRNPSEGTSHEVRILWYTFFSNSPLVFLRVSRLSITCRHLAAVYQISKTKQYKHWFYLFYWEDYPTVSEDVCLISLTSSWTLCLQHAPAFFLYTTTRTQGTSFIYHKFASMITFLKEVSFFSSERSHFLDLPIFLQRWILFTG